MKLLLSIFISIFAMQSYASSFTKDNCYRTLDSTLRYLSSTASSKNQFDSANTYQTNLQLLISARIDIKDKDEIIKDMVKNGELDGTLSEEPCRIAFGSSKPKIKRVVEPIPKITEEKTLDEKIQDSIKRQEDLLDKAHDKHWHYDSKNMRYIAIPDKDLPDSQLKCEDRSSKNYATGKVYTNVYCTKADPKTVTRTYKPKKAIK